jgi:hypothetical protein
MATFADVCVNPLPPHATSAVAASKAANEVATVLIFMSFRL